LKGSQTPHKARKNERLQRRVKKKWPPSKSLGMPRSSAPQSRIALKNRTKESERTYWKKGRSKKLLKEALFKEGRRPGRIKA